MNPYRVVLPFLAALLAGGCVSFPEPAPADTRPSYPVVTGEFVAILEQTVADSYTYRLQADLSAGTVTATGSFDAAARRLVTESTVPGSAGTVRQIVIGDDSWERTGRAGPWVHAERTKSSRYVSLTDPSGLNRFTENIKDVRGDGPNKYLVYTTNEGVTYLPLGLPGTMDVRSSVGGLGEAAAVKFTATTDAAGRLSTISMVMIGTDTVTTTFSKHGEPVTASAPKS